jgi:hypothetical protein
MHVYLINRHLKYQPIAFLHITRSFLLDTQLRFSYIQLPLKRILIKTRFDDIMARP